MNTSIDPHIEDQRCFHQIRHRQICHDQYVPQVFTNYFYIGNEGLVTSVHFVPRSATAIRSRIHKLQGFGKGDGMFQKAVEFLTKFTFCKDKARRDTATRSLRPNSGWNVLYGNFRVVLYHPLNTITNMRRVLP